MRTLLTRHYDSVAAAGWPPLRRYGLALRCTAGAFVLTALLPEIGAHTPYLLYIVAAAAACFYGGFGPGALAFLLANMSDAVFIVDLNRRITHWNHGAEVLYGWQAAEVVGLLAPDILRTAADTETITARLAGVAAGTQNHFEAVHYSRAGELLYVESTATAIRINGILTGHLIMNRNITDRIRHEQELKQLNATLEQLNTTLEQRVRERTAELERSNRELDQFAFVASHDKLAICRCVRALQVCVVNAVRKVIQVSHAKLHSLHQLWCHQALFGHLHESARIGNNSFPSAQVKHTTIREESEASDERSSSNRRRNL